MISMFAVIPSVVVGGPLAILAMLFPAVFGGLLLVLRRWMAALTVASVNSMLYMLYSEFGEVLSNFGWLESFLSKLGLDGAKFVRFLEGLHLDQPMVLWIAMLIVTLLGTIWAWRRHLVAVQAQAELTAFDPARPTMLPFFRTESIPSQNIATKVDSPEGTATLPPMPPIHTSGTQLVLAEAPRRGEHIVLWSLSAIGFGGLAYCLLEHKSLLSQPWITLLVMWTGIWCGTLYTFYLRLTESLRSPLRSGLPLEGVILLAMTITAAGCTGTFSNSSIGSGSTVTTFERASRDSSTSNVSHDVKPLGLAWKFQVPDKGVINASPVVDAEHDRVYFASISNSVFSQSGMVYCLGKTTNEDTGKEEWKVVWKFNNDGQLKQVFSSPCLADGKIYVGEGLHQDHGCKMFCLVAATGEKVWEFFTQSHTESSPFYWQGKLYFGAGDDGMYCIDAVSGEKVWQFQKEKDEDKLHVDANPSVVDGRVYCSSGVGDIAKSTAVFCIDAKTGEQIWLTHTDLPVWGGAMVDGDRVYFGLGNEGYVAAEEQNPKGALLCVDRKTGRTLWRFDTEGAVLCRPAIDGHHVYFGSRDGFCYCLDRGDAKPISKEDDVEGARTRIPPAEARVVWKRKLDTPVLVSPVLARCKACGEPSALYTQNDEGKLYCLEPTTGQPLWVFDAVKASGVKVSASYPTQFYSSPYLVQTRTETGERHRLHFGSGIADDFGYKAIFFCFEAEMDR
jgi:outer membrane protein assembly factor BamB